MTKSGTNAFHGGAFEYFRDESLNSNDPVTKANESRAGRLNKRPALRINQFGGRLGGPIKQNKAFFFFTYDGQRANVPQVLDVPNLSTAPAAARAILLPKLNTYQVGRKQDVFLGKADVKLNDANQLSLRYNHQGFTGVNNENNGTLSAEEHSGNSLVKSDTFSGTLTSTLTHQLVNELRFQLARDKEPGQANSAQPEAVITTGGGSLNIGRNNFSPRETTIKRVQFIDNVSYLRGRSNWKVWRGLQLRSRLQFLSRSVQRHLHVSVLRGVRDEYSFGLCPEFCGAPARPARRRSRTCPNTLSTRRTIFAPPPS